MLTPTAGFTTKNTTNSGETVAALWRASKIAPDFPALGRKRGIIDRSLWGRWRRGRPALPAGFPKSSAGAGGDFSAQCGRHRGNSATPALQGPATDFSVHNDVLLRIPAQLRNPESRRRRKWACREWCRARPVCAIAMTEPGTGSEPAGHPATRAVRDGDEFVISGQKTFISKRTDVRSRDSSWSGPRRKAASRGMSLVLRRGRPAPNFRHGRKP